MLAALILAGLGAIVNVIFLPSMLTMRSLIFDLILFAACALVAWMMLFTHLVWLAVLYVTGCGPDPVDFGFVGDVVGVNRDLLAAAVAGVAGQSPYNEDAQALRDRLRAQDVRTAASPSDELTSLLLEIDALNRTELPIQLQVSVQQDLGGKTVGDQVAFLDSLVQVLENRLVVLEREAQALEPDILVLQERLEEVQTREERLETVKDMSRDTYMTLSRKVTEARIAAQDTTGDVRLASLAAPPQDPASPRPLLNVAVAGALGLMIGILSAFAIEYWQRGGHEGGATG